MFNCLDSFVNAYTIFFLVNILPWRKKPCLKTSKYFLVTFTFNVKSAMSTLFFPETAHKKPRDTIFIIALSFSLVSNEELADWFLCLEYWNTPAIHHVKCHRRFRSSFRRIHGYFAFHHLLTIKGSFTTVSVPCNRTFCFIYSVAVSVNCLR